jgi:hypothetical protein
VSHIPFAWCSTELREPQVHKYQKGNAEIAIVIAIVLGLIALYVAFKIQALAAVIRTDFNTAAWEAGLFTALAALAIGSTWRGYFMRFLCYLPALLVFCLHPALDFWSWDYTLLDQQTGLAGLLTSDNLVATRLEPNWYGSHWVQGLAFFALAGLGYWLDKRRNAY